MGLLRNKIRETLPDLATTLGLPLNISTNVSPTYTGRSPTEGGSSTASPYAPSEPMLPPPLRRQSSSTSSSYGGVAGLSPLAAAPPRFPGSVTRPGLPSGPQALPSGEAVPTSGAAAVVGMAMSASADAMDTDQGPKPYGMPYGPSSGYRRPHD